MKKQSAISKAQSQLCAAYSKHLDNEIHKARQIRHRLEYLRGELRAERISYDELLELQSLAAHIDPSDVELLEAAGVPEIPEIRRRAMRDCAKRIKPYYARKARAALKLAGL